MAIACNVYIGHVSMDTEQTCDFLAIPAIGESVTLPDGTTHTVKQVIHAVGKTSKPPTVSVVLSEERG